MALYHPLNHYLQAAAKRGETDITLTLDEIETILGFPLSHVARQNPDWWQADIHSHHAWTRSWQKAGWVLKKLETGANGEIKAVMFACTGTPSLRARAGFAYARTISPALERADAAVTPIFDRLAEKIVPAIAPRLDWALDQIEMGFKKAKSLYHTHAQPHVTRAGDMAFEKLDAALTRLAPYVLPHAQAARNKLRQGINTILDKINKR